MKRLVTSGYIFAPGAVPPTVDLTAVSGATAASVLAIVDIASNALLYAVGTPGFGGTWTGAKVALLASTLGCAAGDQLQVVVDDGAEGALESSLQAILTKLGTKLSVSIDGDSVQLTLPPGMALDASVQNLHTDLAAFAAANHTDLGLILTKNEVIRALLAGTLKTAPQANTPSVDQAGPLSAAGDAVAVAANGMNTGIVRLPIGWSGSVVVEGTADGLNYDVPLSMQIYASVGNTGALAIITAGGVYEANITGLAGFRVRATSAITGGPITVLVRSSSGIKSSRVGAPAGNPLPTVPGVAAALEASSVPGSLTGANLLSTQPASTRIGLWWFQNQSTATLAVVLDDGAGNAQTLCEVGGGAGAAQQGGDVGHYMLGPHQGRIRVYGPAGSQHALRVM